MSRPRLAVTLGDPRGIGPEITAAALATPLDAEVTLIGAEDQIATLPADHRVPVGTWGQGSGDNGDRGRALRAGRIAGHAVETAARLALAGEVDAIVTAPAHKHALHLAGFPFPGHTEWLAQLAGGVDVAMMLASDELRVVLVTTHVPFRDVPALLTARAGDPAPADDDPGIARLVGHPPSRGSRSARVNPHAGEGGLFGDEETRVLAPAAEALGAAGPLPADTVFVRAMRGEFDAVLAPYHDVGMTAIKVAAFGRAVNVTLGLPFPRTSPDHGTAFDIAGTGKADASSMRAALEMAEGWRGGKGRLTGAQLLPPSPSALRPFRLLQPLHQPEIRLQLELLRRAVGDQHRAALQDRLPLDQSVRPQRVAGVHQVHDPVGEVEQRSDLDRSVHRHDVHRPPAGAEVRMGQPGVLGGHPGGDPPGQGGIAGARRARPPRDDSDPKPRSSGSSTSAPVSRSTSVPVTPRSAAPDST